jgi:hypothetical protein
MSDVNISTVAASANQPTLAFVATTRNDSDDALNRTQLFVNALAAQARRHNLNAELVLVEWNPPPGRPPLARALRWPNQPGPCTIRLVPVPPEIHRRFPNSDRLPLFQMIAKNVGIRRARGRFILATNIDILFSDEMIGFFASGRLSHKAMYRVDMYNVESDIPYGAGIDEQLAYCRARVTRIYTRDGVRPPTSKLRASLLEQAKEWLGVEPGRLHTNACGDFTLMAREHWLAVRGYAEFPTRASKIDGLLCYAAHYAGAKEITLRDPLRIYHIEHLARADGMQEALAKRKTGETELELDRQQYAAWTGQMRREKQPLIFNPDESWGLAADSLPETITVLATGS